MNVVAYEEGHKDVHLEKKLLLEDAISDLPAVCYTCLIRLVFSYKFCAYILFCLLCYMQVENDERRDEMPYHEPPKTEFQHLIRSPREG